MSPLILAVYVPKATGALVRVMESGRTTWRSYGDSAR